MSNPMRNEAVVILDGEEKTLVFNYAALMEIENAFGGKSIDSIFFSGDISRSAIGHAIRAGLAKRNRPMTMSKVAGLIGATLDKNPGALEGFTRAIMLGILGGSGKSQDEIDKVASVIDEAIEDAKPKKVNPSSSGAEAGENS